MQIKSHLQIGFLLVSEHGDVFAGIDNGSQLVTFNGTLNDFP